MDNLAERKRFGTEETSTRLTWPSLEEEEEEEEEDGVDDDGVNGEYEQQWVEAIALFVCFCFGECMYVCVSVCEEKRGQQRHRLHRRLKGPWDLRKAALSC